MATETIIIVSVWAAITVAATLIEVFTPQLVSIWFAIAGAVCVGLSFIPGLPVWGTVIIFAVLSVILLFALRPTLSKLMKKNKDLKTNVDSLIGKKVRMTAQADFDNLGQARVGDVVWSVKSQNGEILKEGEIVEIIDVDGNKLIAVPTEEAKEEAK
ncbi:MAG: NfeD family protein [Clostridia bacterium]|nr:NfeD family protein [Clostridia bacterium]